MKEIVSVLIIVCAVLDIFMIAKGDMLWPLFLVAFIFKVPHLAKLIGG